KTANITFPAVPGTADKIILIRLFSFSFLRCTFLSIFFFSTFSSYHIFIFVVLFHFYLTSVLFPYYDSFVSKLLKSCYNSRQDSKSTNFTGEHYEFAE